MKMKTYATFDEYFADQAARNQAIIRVFAEVREASCAATSGIREVGKWLLDQWRCSGCLRAL